MRLYSPGQNMGWIFVLLEEPELEQSMYATKFLHLVHR